MCILILLPFHLSFIKKPLQIYIYTFHHFAHPLLSPTGMPQKLVHQYITITMIIYTVYIIIMIWILIVQTHLKHAPP